MAYVEEGSKTVDAGVNTMMKAMRYDYLYWHLNSRTCKEVGELRDVNKKMIAEFNENLDYTVGKKYIKVVEKTGGVKCFVVNCENDKKFPIGTIVKPAGWASPARNFSRGNVLEGKYKISWTGA